MFAFAAVINVSIIIYVDLDNFCAFKLRNVTALKPTLANQKILQFACHYLVLVFLLT